MLLGVMWQPNRQTGSRTCSPYFWKIQVPNRDPPRQWEGTPRFSHSAIQGPDWPFRTLLRQTDDMPTSGLNLGDSAYALENISSACQNSLWSEKWGRQKSASMLWYAPHTWDIVALALGTYDLDTTPITDKPQTRLKTAQEPVRSSRYTRMRLPNLLSLL